jgi:lysophospholipase L1-like esterase
MLLRRTGAAAACVVCTALVGCSEGTTEPPLEEDVPVRIVTFGDSNTDNGWSGTDPEILARSYVSRAPLRLGPLDPHDPRQLAAKIEVAWQAVRNNPITAVNHGIGGTTTGGGGFGGGDRHPSGSPNARTMVHEITRFEAEVLGRGAPDWDGGEPTNGFYPDGPIRRRHAFVPGPNDFAYVSLGTNDFSSGIGIDQTLTNLQWMVEQWIAADLPASHFLLTTLPPATSPYGPAIREVNQGIRRLGAEEGIHIIDLSAHTSDDDGLTWKSDQLHVGDEVHYSEAVREWIAAQAVAHMRDRIPGR